MSHTSNHLLTDVNLAGIGFSEDGRTLTIEFLNMTDGQPCARLIANGVILLHYHNIFDSGDGLAAYVGEVTVQELGMDESGLVLSQLGYGFRGSGMERHSMLIHIEGGEVAVDIVCSEYHLIGHASNG